MKQLWKRHYTSFNQLRKYTSISDNIDLLNSTPAHRTHILYATLLQTCTRERAFRQGLQFQAHVIRQASKAIALSETVYLSVRNLITWNSMISGFAQNGRGEEAVKLFDEMIKVGIQPDNVTFLSVLSACSHSRLLDQGRHYFVSMTNDYGIKAEISHYRCMMDLLGRESQIEEAENLISQSEFSDDSSLWTSLLVACTTGTNHTVAERVAKKVMKLRPEYHLSYVLLGNVYREVGRWNDALEITRQMKEKRS